MRALIHRLPLVPGASVSLTATIPAGLSVGTHVVSVRSQDAVGNWSATGTINLVVDNVGPTSSGLNLTPNRAMAPSVLLYPLQPAMSPAVIAM